jgi:hypothetical protein
LSSWNAAFAPQGIGFERRALRRSRRKLIAMDMPCEARARGPENYERMMIER